MIILPDLPFDYDALEPVISADTLHTHHDKHHRAYVEATNKLAGASGLEGRALEDIVREAHRKGDAKLFHNAAQTWNHAFFWQSMTDRAASPSAALTRRLGDGFDGTDGLRDAFVTEGAEHFGSGWVWLVTGSDGLKVISTHDADNTLIKDGLFPLLVCDLWEHAYYLDFKNDRKTFLGKWFDTLANWSFVERQLAALDQQDDAKGFRYPAPTGGARPGVNSDDRPRV
jgi:Fe-Mn family superoxide dismutase